MNEIQIFNHPQFGKIRTAGTSEDPMFCLKDVCDALGLRVDGVIKRIGDPNPIGVLDSNGHRQGTYFINEKNLYRVIMRSNKKEAVLFQNWVCEEVLPCIRRNGMYATDETLEKLIGEPDFGIRMMKRLRKERAEKKQLTEAHKKLQDEMGRIKPMADYCNRVLNTQQTVTVTQIAQDYGYSARAFNELLRDMGIQFRQSEQWMLYASLKKKGYELKVE